MQRVHSIDYLRGLLAFLVMIYHYISWSVGVPDSSTALGRLGIYAVSVFYVISGISLYIVYARASWGFRDVLSFAVKRFLRIAPLYWVATIITVAFFALKSGSLSQDWGKLASNLTLTFGFFEPRNYIPTGGWSIGNEMVFYAMFPGLMLLASRAWWLAAGLLAFGGVYFYFSFYHMTPHSSLAMQWGDYVNPFNQAFLFVLGIAVAWITKKYQVEGGYIPYLAFAASLLFFVFWSSEGDQINIVTGVNRLIFTLLCVLACWAALNVRLEVGGVPGRLLKGLGDGSYAIYLLHGPVQLFAVAYIYPHLGAQQSPAAKLCFLLLVSAPASLLASYFVFRFVEQPFIQLGKKLTRGMSKPEMAASR